MLLLTSSPWKEGRGFREQEGRAAAADTHGRQITDGCSMGCCGRCPARHPASSWSRGKVTTLGLPHGMEQAQGKISVISCTRGSAK